MRIIILFTFLFLAHFDFVKSVCNKEWCIVKFLSETRAISSNLSEESNNYQCDNDCESLIENLKEDFITSVVADLKKEDNKTCFVEFFNEYKIDNLYLKGIVFNNLNLTKISSFEEEKVKSMEEARGVAKSLCSKERLTQENFVQAILMLSMGTLYRLHDNDEIEDRCIMNHLFENKITDLSEFAFPDDLTECQEIVLGFENQTLLTLDAWTTKRTFTIFGLSTNNFHDCLKKKLADQHFFLKIAAFYLASNLDLTDVKEEKLRDGFTQTMEGFNKSFYGCTETFLEL